MQEFLTPGQTAKRLGVTANTLAQWRATRTGPPYVKLGDGPKARVRYPAGDLDKWLEARQVAS